MNVTILILTLLAGLFFGLISALFANKSTKEVRGMTLSPVGWAIPLIIGGALAVVYYIFTFTRGAWIFVIALAVLTLLQAINAEGRARRASWNTLAVEASLWLVLEVAEALDKAGAKSPVSMWWILIPILAPFIVGGISTAVLNARADNEDGEERQHGGNGGFYKTLVLGTIAAVAVMFAIGFGVIAFR